MSTKSFQECYPEGFNKCYGCGEHNDQGHHIKSYWDGEESVAMFTPEEFHMAVPGFVYGGLLASLIDCHGVGTAVAAIYRAQNRTMDTEPSLRFVTASLKVDFLAPTPLGPELEIRGKVHLITEKKVVVRIQICANDLLCVRGEVIAVPLPASMASKIAP